MINENKRIAESQQKIQQISKMLVGYLPVRKEKKNIFWRSFNSKVTVKKNKYEPP